MKTQGLIAATFCGYNNDGSLNISVIPKLVEKLIDDGLKGIFICGTNGEGPNLTLEERMLITETYIKAANKRISIFVHVGHSCIAEAKKLAFHAQISGADAISSVGAFYFKPSSVLNLVESVREIAMAAPEVPFYYYHIPALTGISLDMVEFLKVGEKMIPSLHGIKYTANTLFEYQSCLNYKNGKYDILFGYDEMLLSALAIGARGAIGSTYTFAARLYLKVMELFAAGHLSDAQALQLRLVEMIRCILRYPTVPAQRAIMKMLKFELGSSRLPLRELNASDCEALENALNDIGFFDLLYENRADADRSKHNEFVRK